MWDLKFPDQGSNLYSLHSECRVLNMGWPRKSLQSVLKTTWEFKHVVSNSDFSTQVLCIAASLFSWSNWTMILCLSGLLEK